MKAAVLYGNREIRYDDWETPKTQAGTVLVHVRATGICGSDVPRVLHNGAHFYPVVLGHEFAGDVAEVGEGVTSVRVGDTVTGAPLLPCMRCDDCGSGNFSLCKNYSFIGSRQQGSFAEYVVLPEQNAVKYDPHIPYEQAAMFEPSTVALHGVLCGDYRPGGRVAVLGCGTIGIFALQWAKILGAREVSAFDIDDGRLALAERMGARETVNTQKESYADRAQQITQGRGFDYVFEAAGNPATIQMGFALAGNKAHMCCIGTPHTELRFTPAQWEQLNRKEFVLTGSWMSYSAPFPGREWTMTAHYFASGELRFDPAFIYKKYPLSEVAAAFKEFEHPECVHGKIMLVNE